MKLETFFEKFDQFADAPDAVEKMRGLLIQLAVQGKLVPNDSSEIPVNLKLSGEDEDAAPLPSNWRSGLLGEVLSFEYGDNLPAPKRSESGEYPVYGSNGIVGTHDTYLTREPAIIIGRKGSAGALNISAGPSWTTDVAYFVRPPREIDLRYTYYLLASLHLDELGKGIKPGLSRKEAYTLPVAIPPPAEQKRIVAKVDELMALCDRLEAQQKERETRHAALTRAATARFNEAPTPANLDFLFHPSYSVTASYLRKTILNLAVQGKLISQDPNDQSVDELLATSDKQRQETARSDRRASTDVTSLLSADDRWDIPDSWSWRALADLVLFIDYRGKTPKKVPSGIRLITAKNVRKGELNLSPEEFLSETDYRAWMTRGLPERGDVLFTTEAPMGNVAVVELAERFGLAQRIICFRSYGSLDPSFLVLQILSASFQFILDKNATGMTAKGIKAGKLKLLPVAVPPLAEQRRIVAKVDLLMRIVDQLENQLRESRTFYKELLDAVVHELLHPAAEVVEFPLSASDRASQRTATGCYAIEHLKRNPSFGHTMNMKVVYMAQAHIGLPLDLKFERQAAGPWHPWIEEFDAMGQGEGWFTLTQKSIGDGRTKYEYVPKAALKQKVAEAAAVLGEHRAEFDRLLGFFANMKTVEAEIVATLFAAWNDFLIDGKTPTDDEIIREVRENWHQSKERFTPALLQRWLEWIRSHDLTPVGRGPRTRQQLTLRLN